MFVKQWFFFLILDPDTFYSTFLIIPINEFVHVCGCVGLGQPLKTERQKIQKKTFFLSRPLTPWILRESLKAESVSAESIFPHYCMLSFYRQFDVDVAWQKTIKLCSHNYYRDLFFLMIVSSGPVWTSTFEHRKAKLKL